MGNILNGKEISLKIKESIKKEIASINSQTTRVPCLAVIQVGNNSASSIYVNSKIRQCEEVGIKSKSIILPEDILEEKLLQEVRILNRDKEVDGILVQLPLPKHINEHKVIEAIDINKDVDGFKPENLGKVALGDETALIPCTPNGVMQILKEYEIEVSGKDVVIIGRSNIVGKPMASLLINEGATVTICNSKTKNLDEKTKEADIIIVAVGKEKFLKEHMVKDGVVVIDVGINRDSNNKVCGDVDFEAVKSKCSYITPVPGGVGVMTIAMLLKNTMQCFANNIEQSIGNEYKYRQEEIDKAKKLKTHLIEELLELTHKKSILNTDIARIMRDYFVKEDMDEIIGEFQEKEVFVQDCMNFIKTICLDFKYELFLEKQFVLEDISKAVERNEMEIIVPINISPKIKGYSFIANKIDGKREYKIIIKKEATH